MLFLFSILFLSFGSYAKTCSTAYDFDYLLLATQWPESFCETTKCTVHQDIWSIHGAWPQYNSGKWPQDCCFDHEFRPNQIESIKDELVKHWKTLKASGDNNDFWSHEWSKHGTCAKNSALLNGELNYFKNTLNAFSKLSLDKWLSDSSITPSQSKVYSVSELHSALTKGLGYKVQLECLSKKHNSSPILAQINVCLNKDTLKPFDCPKNMSDENCGQKTIAYLPSK